MARFVPGLASGLLGFALLLQPRDALPHPVALPIEGAKLMLKTQQGASKQRVRFIAKDQSPALALGHDPAQSSTWLLLRGYGTNGGSTGKIELDPSKWKTLGRDENVRGYRYSDKAGTRGGVRKIIWKPGSISISAGGANWPWSPQGPQDWMGVYFGIEDETVCADFGGEIKRNEAGAFRSKRAPAPADCPEAVCGNGVVELGEVCDDGNLVEDDGCTRECVEGTCVASTYNSTYEAIQDVVFDQGGCTNTLCHGAEPGQGQLNLDPNVAYQNLIEVPATATAHDRVVPGAPRDSELWIRLAKAADPNGIEDPVAGMPFGAPALPDDLIEAVRLWIGAGAPETGTVTGTEDKLSACLPEVTPISITPLPPPDPNEGMQLAMPGYDLLAQTEVETCFATYYDIRDQVPARFMDPNREFFYMDNSITRQDPHSHHMILMHSGIDDQLANDPSFGTWTCVGGSLDGQECDPLDTASCDDGSCRSQVGPNIACIGFGPPGGATGASTVGRLGGSGNGQLSLIPGEGYFTRVRTTGIVYWNSHAFNTTSYDHFMAARTNLIFTDDLQFELVQFQYANHIYDAAGQLPFTKATYCRDYVVPQGRRMISLSSHTHQRGEVFWILDPADEQIYINYTYDDPLTKVFDPPLAFDSPSTAGRTLTYCATYNNGVAPDGSPDPSSVRKRSVTPQNAALCYPLGCTEGQIGAPCNGPTDHASCDSSPGAGDGLCDACTITAGVSTEDEMFVLLGSYYYP